MSENLAEVLEDDTNYLAYKRAQTIKKLGERTHLTMERIAKLMSHKEYGEIVAGITLQELLDASSNTETDAVAEASPAPKKRGRPAKKTTKTTAKKRGRPAKKTTKTVGKKAAKKKAAKSTKAPAAKSTKAPAKKASKTKRTGKKKAAIAKKSSSGHKADYGTKKPRLNREQGFKEVVAALTAAGEPCGRSALEKATGYTGVQVRTFCKELMEQGKIQMIGKGGRGTKYALA